MNIKLKQSEIFLLSETCRAKKEDLELFKEKNFKLMDSHEREQFDKEIHKLRLLIHKFENL